MTPSTPALLRVPALALGLALLVGCSAAPRAPDRTGAASPGVWLAMTMPEGLPVEFVQDAQTPPQTAQQVAPPEQAVAEHEDEGHGFGHTVLLYIPNRIFDILDIVRLRVRLGPGFAVDARATELADVFFGAYTSVFVGIPGPRGAPYINWPVGIENNVGGEISVLDGSSSEDRHGPHYGAVEFGVGVQVILVGADVGVDPWEAVDFVVGLLTFDPVHDDL